MDCWFVAFETPEQRVKILFCVFLHKSTPETLRKLEEAYSKAAVKKTQVYELHKRFRGGRVSVNNDSR
jgi:helix-turn-helix protein